MAKKCLSGKRKRSPLRRTPPPDDDSSHLKRPFTTFSEEQREKLEKSFARCRYPDKFKREEIADKTELTEAQVKTWFANRRATQRKQDSFSSQVSLGMNPVSGNSDTIKVPPPPRGSKRRSSSKQERPPKRPRKVSRDRASPDRAIAGEEIVLGRRTRKKKSAAQIMEELKKKNPEKQGEDKNELRLATPKPGHRKKKTAEEIMREVKAQDPERREKIRRQEMLERYYQQPGEAGPSHMMLSDEQREQSGTTQRRPSEPEEELEFEVDEEFVVEEVLDKRITEHGITEFLIKREGYPHSENMWIAVLDSDDDGKDDVPAKVKIMDIDGDMERPPRGSGPRNRPPYKSRMDRRRPSRGRQSRPRADSGAPRGKRDYGDAPNKFDASDDYESKSDENNSDNVNVSPSSNHLSSGSGEPRDSAQTNEGCANENSPEQDQGSGSSPASLLPDLEEHEVVKLEQSHHKWQQEFAKYVRWFHNKGLEAPIPSCLKEALDADADAEARGEEADSPDGWWDLDEDSSEAEEEQGAAEEEEESPSPHLPPSPLCRRRRYPAVPLSPSSSSSSSSGEASPPPTPSTRQSPRPTGRRHHVMRQSRSPSPHLPPSPLSRRRRYPAIPLTPSSASSSSGEPSPPHQPPTPPPRQSPRPAWRSDRGMRHSPGTSDSDVSPLPVAFADAPRVIAPVPPGTRKVRRFWKRNGTRTSLRSLLRFNYNVDDIFEFQLKGHVI